MRSFIQTWFLHVRKDYTKSKFINFNYKPLYKNSPFPDSVETSVLMTSSDNIKDGYLNKKFNRFTTMGRVRNYNKYHSYFGSNYVETKSRRILAKNRSVKEMIDSNRGSFNYDNDLPLPLTKNSRLVGVYNLTNKNKFFHKDCEPDFTVRELLRRASPEFKELDDNHFIKVLPGSWKYNYQNLVDMATPVNSEYSIDDLIEGIKSRKDIDLVLPLLPKYDVNTINHVRVNHTSSPGINTKNLIGPKRSVTTSRTKPVAYQYARDIIQVPRNNYVVDTSLYSVGGREKKIIIPYKTPYKQIKTRVTLNQEDIPTIIGQSVVVLINESLQKISEGFNWGGRINGRGRYLDLISNLKCKDGYTTNFNTDFSGHDNSVTERQMVVGMSLLRCCFPICDKIDRIFYYILSSLVFKRIVLPESNLVYELSKGLPTGHSFTSILTTITAYMKISTAINKVIPKSEIKETHLQGAGDDWCGVMPIKYLSAVSTHINTFSGAKCDDFSINANSILSNKTYPLPTFLKKKYTSYGLSWYIPELFTNLSYPTSTKLTLNNFVQNCMVMCTSGPFDQDLNKIMKNVILVKYCEFELKMHKRLCLGLGIEIGPDVEKRLKVIKDLCGVNMKNTVPLNHRVFTPFDVKNRKGVVLLTLDLTVSIQQYFDEFDAKIHNSMKFMWSKRIYEKFETLVRLKVFDTKKKYIRNDNLNINRSFITKYYLIYKSWLC